MLAGREKISLHTRPLGTEVTGWVSFIRRNFPYIHEHWGRRSRGVFLLLEGIFITYTTTGLGGDGVGLFCQKEFSLYTRALGTEVRGCVAFVMELY